MNSFQVGDANNEVVCPLKNQDNSSCRKRCIGEKRYRSMQEHIRRAHPEHYISKLPATEESFQLMINSTPSQRPTPHASANLGPKASYARDRPPFYRDDSTTPNTPRNQDEYQSASMLPAASAAAALAQLHNHKAESDWDSEPDWHSDTEAHSRTQIMRSSIELPPIHHHNLDITSEPYPHLNTNRSREMLPSILSASPPGRSTTLPPLQRHHSQNRPRKQSLSKRARDPQHRRQRSKGDHQAAHLRRMSYDRKAFSAEPSSAYGKRWEDLIDAATSATSDVDDDRTPVPPSPISITCASLPPFSMSALPTQGQFQQGPATYTASPLQRALTPPSLTNPHDREPFPSIESTNSTINSNSTASTTNSANSGSNFHMGRKGLESDSSPTFSNTWQSAATKHSSQHASINQEHGVKSGSGSSRDEVQIYCAACQRASLLRESYACTECICGLCAACVEVLMGAGDGGGGGGGGGGAPRGVRRCPKCSTIGGKFKPFMLDIR